MKEYQQSVDSYRKALAIDPNSADARAGMQKSYTAMRETMTDDERAQQAQNDPKVQEILGDPVMRQGTL